MIKLKIPTRNDVDQIMFDDEIWQRTSDDLSPKKEAFKLSYENYEWLGFYIDNKIIGTASIEKDGRFHFEILKPYRNHAREAIKLTLSLIQRDIYCAIPLYHQSLINFAKKHGFKEIGILEERFLKNGINYNRIKLIYDKSS